MASEDKQDYLIGTNSDASARLNLQHYWTEMSCGYLIHPDIPVHSHAKIADIATGTGLPSSVQLDGFDITDAQFPPREWLPANVTLDTMNILAPVPQHLAGKYDVVNIRYFGLLVKNNDHLGLLKHLTSLLKPGGFLQWIEADVTGQRVISSRPDIPRTASESLNKDGKEFLSSSGLSYDWLRELPTSCQDIGLVGVKQFKVDPVPALRPIFSFGAVGGWAEFSHTILDKYGPNPIIGSGQQLRQRIREVREEFQAGVAFEQQLYVVIGQRPV